MAHVVRIDAGEQFKRAISVLNALPGCGIRAAMTSRLNCGSLIDHAREVVLIEQVPVQFVEAAELA
jgi:hypothetical protein